MLRSASTRWPPVEKNLLACASTHATAQQYSRIFPVRGPTASHLSSNARALGLDAATQRLTSRGRALQPQSSTSSNPYRNCCAQHDKLLCSGARTQRAACETELSACKSFVFLGVELGAVHSRILIPASYFYSCSLFLQVFNRQNAAGRLVHARERT